MIPIIILLLLYIILLLINNIILIKKPGPAGGHISAFWVNADPACRGLFSGSCLGLFFRFSDYWSRQQKILNFRIFKYEQTR